MCVSKIIGVVVGFVVVILLVGCLVGGGNIVEGEQDIMVWFYFVIVDEVVYKDFWDFMIVEFEKENENVNVKYEIFLWVNCDEVLQMVIVVGKGFDVVYLIFDQFVVYQKLIVFLNDLFSQECQDDLFLNVKDLVMIDGDIFGVLIFISVQFFICNVVVFEVVGVIEYFEIWDDIVDIVLKFIVVDMYVLNYLVFVENIFNLIFYLLLWQVGGQVYDDEGQVGFDSKVGDEVFIFIIDFVKFGVFDFEVLIINVLFEQIVIVQGKVVCIWNNVVIEVVLFWGEENVKVFVLFIDKEFVVYGIVGLLLVFKGFKVQDVVVKFVEFVISVDVVEFYFIVVGYFLVLSIIELLYVDDLLFGEVEKYVFDIIVGEFSSSFCVLMGVFVFEIQVVLLGQKFLVDVLKDVVVVVVLLVQK